MREPFGSLEGDLELTAERSTNDVRKWSWMQTQTSESASRGKWVYFTTGTAHDKLVLSLAQGRSFFRKDLTPRTPAILRQSLPAVFFVSAELRHPECCAVIIFEVLPRKTTNTAEYAAVAVKTSCLFAFVKIEQEAENANVKKKTVRI